MLSKLTFSLALVLMLAIVAAPAMAQTASTDLNTDTPIAEKKVLLLPH